MTNCGKYGGGLKNREICVTYFMGEPLHIVNFTFYLKFI